MRIGHGKRTLCPYLNGDRLYGDDASVEEIESWYADEKDAYAELVRQYPTYDNSYHALNEFHAFRELGKRRFHVAIAFGCAGGDDVKPLAPRVDRFIAIEPSERFWSRSIGGTPTEYMRPAVSGRMRGSRGAVDLIVCLGVLHHIPNVSFVISEFGRVLADKGLLILREPVCSLGDWRKSRRGLTKRERGIPIEVLTNRLRENDFRILRSRFCGFPLIPRIARVVNVHAPYNSPLLVRLDHYLSMLLSWNYHYHRVTVLEKLAPRMLFLVAEKVNRDAVASAPKSP